MDRFVRERDAVGEAEAGDDLIAVGFFPIRAELHGAALDAALAVPCPDRRAAVLHQIIGGQPQLAVVLARLAELDIDMLAHDQPVDAADRDVERVFTRPVAAAAVVIVAAAVLLHRLVGVDLIDLAGVEHVCIDARTHRDRHPDRQRMHGLLVDGALDAVVRPGDNRDIGVGGFLPVAAEGVGAVLGAHRTHLAGDRRGHDAVRNRLFELLGLLALADKLILGLLLIQRDLLQLQAQGVLLVLARTRNARFERRDLLGRALDRILLPGNVDQQLFIAELQTVHIIAEQRHARGNGVARLHIPLFNRQVAVRVDLDDLLRLDDAGVAVAFARVADAEDVRHRLHIHRLLVLFAEYARDGVLHRLHKRRNLHAEIPRRREIAADREHDQQQDHPKHDPSDSLLLHISSFPAAKAADPFSLLISYTLVASKTLQNCKQCSVSRSIY